MTPNRTKSLTTKEWNRINAASANSQERVAAKLAEALVLATDARKEQRLAIHLCPCCYYQGTQYAGQGFTEWECLLCETPGMYATTDVPLVCDTCSDSFGLCRSCGGTLDMARKTSYDKRVKRTK